MKPKKVATKIRNATNLTTGTRSFILHELLKAYEDDPKHVTDGICLCDCFLSYNNTPQGWHFWRLVAHLIGESAWHNETYPESFLSEDLDKFSK